MKFNLAIKVEAANARSYLEKLINEEKVAEVKLIRKQRSLNQNAYLHLIIGYFGVHFGYTLEEAKQVYKEINNAIYVYEKKGQYFYRSSADLNTAEMTKSIDKFREQSRKAGCPLPPPTDQGWLREIENEIERSGYYL